MTLRGRDYVFKPFRVDHAIENSETFRVGSTLFTSHFMPGHTPDSTLLAFDFQGCRSSADIDANHRAKIKRAVKKEVSSKANAEGLGMGRTGSVGLPCFAVLTQNVLLSLYSNSRAG